MTTPASGDAAGPGRVEFSTSDPEHAIDYLSHAYRTNLLITGARGAHLYRHSRADGGSFVLDNLRLPLHMDLVRSEPQDSLVVVRIDTGKMEYERGDINERFLTGDVYVDAEPTLPAILRVLGFEAQITVLDMAALAQVAATSPTRAAGPIRLTSFRAMSAVAALRWQRTVTFLRDVLENTEASAQPLIRGSAARMLAATVLTTFPNTAIIDPTAQDRRDATSTTLRRAIALIEQHPHADISVADIAAAANVSIRAVQFAFRRQLDTSRWPTYAWCGWTARTTTCWPPTPATATRSPLSPPAGASTATAASPPNTAAPTA